MSMAKLPTPTVTPGPGTSSAPDSEAFSVTGALPVGAGPGEVVTLVSLPLDPLPPPQAAAAVRTTATSTRRGLMGGDPRTGRRKLWTFIGDSPRQMSKRSGVRPPGQNEAVLLAEVVDVSARVAATPARSAKVAALADLLRQLAA